jgi:hypothetical protein
MDIMTVAVDLVSEQEDGDAGSRGKEHLLVHVSLPLGSGEKGIAVHSYISCLDGHTGRQDTK